MFLNAASPRRSFSIPINMNLQGGRRRQTREFFHPVAVQEQVWRRGLDGHGGERAKPQMPVSSVGEERAILLGFALMAFSVLMFFVAGITTVKPYINSSWDEEASCVLVQTDVMEEWVECRGMSTAPCLRVTANITGSGKKALLHYDEESVHLTPECFYIPKCQMDRTEVQDEVLKVKSNLNNWLGHSLSCLTDPTRHPEDAILNRKYTMRRALFALLWPSLMLGGGALVVGLVKLTQCLAHLCSQLCCETTEGRVTSKYTHGKLYQLLRRRASANSHTGLC